MERKIIKLPLQSFCFGVKNAVEETKRILSNNNINKPIHMLGEIVWTTAVAWTAATIFTPTTRSYPTSDRKCRMRTPCTIWLNCFAFSVIPPESASFMFCLKQKCACAILPKFWV